MLSLLLTGCGFQLRDRASILTDLDGVRLVASDELAAVRDAFHRALRDRGAGLLEPAPSPAEGRLILVRLLRETSTRRSVLTSASLDAAEYVLRLEVDLSVQVEASSSPGMVTLATERTYSVDPANLSASYEEEALLLDEMREELARRMVRRVESAAAQKHE